MATLLLVLAGAAVAQISVVNSKHNLSSGGTGSYISADPSVGGTAEICIFCHTPHQSNNQAPLWNRQASTATYLTYTSDVLVGLNYPSAEDPSNASAPGYAVHVKTRICLTCHDGTIGLGHLVNLGYTPAGKRRTVDVRMVNTNADGSLPNTAAGYMGTDLRDDHPVAIPYDNSKDSTELYGSVGGGKISLYYVDLGGVVRKTAAAGSANYVECTSCHNAHDNQYKNFLVEPNTGSQLCTHCHNKQVGAGTSAHDAATSVSYDPDGTGSIGTSVGGVKCLNCHYSHKSGVDPANPAQPNTSYGKYLLSFQEEGTCFNKKNRWGRDTTVCHGSTSSTKNIESQEIKTSAHRDTGSYAGVHQATEHMSYNWLGTGNAKWHVECNDCHNSHSAGNAKHTSPGNTIGNTSPLYGVGGVSISWTGSWSAPGQAGFTAFESLGLTNSTAMPLNYYEYQVCMKCHSSYAWGLNTPPLSPSLGGLQNMTDQAIEFNPGNIRTAGVNGASMHPVAGATGNTLWGALLGSWTANRGTQTMYCSDCHGTNDGTAPQGPHGSTNPFILKTAFTDTYTNTKTLVQSSGVGLTDDLCFQCHAEDTYQSGAANFNPGGTGFSGGGTNLHTQHRIRASAAAQSTFGYRCVNCHARVSHGYNRTAMIVKQNDGDPYEAGGTGAGKIKTVTLTGAGAYVPGFANRDLNCTTVNGCHQ